MVVNSNHSNPAVDSIKTLSPPDSEIIETSTTLGQVQPDKPSHKVSKQAIRSSLKASTLDGVFSSIFGSITGGVLLSNFLLQLGATSIEIGMLSSFPMLMNLLQPVGAYFAERSTSRFRYGLGIFGPSRLLWSVLALGILIVTIQHGNPHQLVGWTLAMVLVSNIFAALGSPSWLSWMVVLVPQRLRGRYFGFRNSAASLTTLLSVPLFGFAVSAWPGGAIQGYGAVLFLGVVAGLISLGCQFFMADVNPQAQRHAAAEESGKAQESQAAMTPTLLRLDPNFLKFLLYVALWAFAVNVSAPFFNLYMLADLAIDVKWVTLYSSLTAGANLLMLVVWGKLADRLGNRPILLLVGILVAVTPLFWLGAGNNSLSLWLWLPLIHLLGGGTGAAIDLCNNNMQMNVAPERNKTSYFAIAAAVAGVSGALGTTTGGFIAQFADYGGLPGLFALSSVLRLGALLPLVFVREHRSQPLTHVWLTFYQSMRTTFPVRPRLVSISGMDVTNSSQ